MSPHDHPLLAWWAHAHRDLPWRATRDPWAILVAELMLQQTQVDRVVEPWQRFLGRFPNCETCASADVGEVIRLWRGLGYNRRAIRLHEAATVVVDEHDGQVPGDLAALMSLPGVGPYTARAVRVFAFERDDAVVDTNVARILARAHAGRRLATGEAQRLADSLVPPGGAWLHNQAMLDLGATVCRKVPACHRCPLRGDCRWFATGCEDPDPALGTAGASGRQSRFEGSDRQGRGRLIDALRAGPVDTARIPESCGWPDQPDRARRVADTLAAEGLARYEGGRLALPGGG